MEELVSCLRDADCDSDLISDICRLYEDRYEGIVFQKLCRHRNILMDALHARQRKVDCLDFLLQKLTKAGLPKQTKNGGR